MNGLVTTVLCPFTKYTHTDTASNGDNVVHFAAIVPRERFFFSEATTLKRTCHLEILTLTTDFLNFMCKR